MGESWQHFDLNEKIVSNLTNFLNFDSPTKIQEKVLTYVNSKVDLVIQARTGEGKTLSYGIPIVNYILNFYDRAEDKIKKISPVALILVPTRELGLQVNQHITAILKDMSLKEEKEINTEKIPKKKEKNIFDIKVANVLGGFAKAKQIKILNKYKPEIIIATPGRLWEIIENEDSPFVNKFYKLRFLVLDEADRMTEKGHFKELKSILDFVYTKQETVDLKKENLGEEIDENKDSKVKNKIKNLMKSSKGKDQPAGETDDLSKNDENNFIKSALKKKGIHVDVNKIEEIDPLEMFGDEDNIIDDINIDEAENMEENNEEGNHGEDENYESGDLNHEDLNQHDEDVMDFDKFRKQKRQDEKFTKEFTPKHQVSLRTILCSATIEKIHKQEESKHKKSNKSKANQVTTETGDVLNMENLLKNVKFYNKLIYVGINYNNANNLESKSESQNESNILPEKLKLDCYKCEAVFKDYYLFHILKENEKKSIIVFTNSISHTKKLFSIFSFFDFKLTVLHSKMQQKQRIKNLERFKTHQKNILFCTDVGARGLDIPLVDLVLHYHIPKTTEMFIHRSGRTARASTEGKCTSLISEAELKLYKNIMKDLKFKEFPMKTLNVAQLEKYKSLFEYTKKIERDEHTVKKQNREKQWFEKKASECEMIFEDDDRDDRQDEEKEQKFLNKKRNLMHRENIKDKKVFHKISASNIKRTSFITPELAAKLNNLISDDKMRDINLTKAIFDANSDAESFKNKGKQRKKRYLRRRKNK